MTKKNVMIDEQTFLRICKLLENLDLRPDEPDLDLLREILPVLEEKLEKMCRRAEYSRSLSAGPKQGRHAPVPKPADKENL